MGVSREVQPAQASRSSTRQSLSISRSISSVLTINGGTKRRTLLPAKLISAPSLEHLLDDVHPLLDPLLGQHQTEKQSPAPHSGGQVGITLGHPLQLIDEVVALFPHRFKKAVGQHDPQDLDRGCGRHRITAEGGGMGAHDQRGGNRVRWSAWRRWAGRCPGPWPGS